MYCKQSLLYYLVILVQLETTKSSAPKLNTPWSDWRNQFPSVGLDPPRMFSQKWETKFDNASSFLVDYKFINITVRRKEAWTDFEGPAHPQLWIKTKYMGLEPPVIIDFHAYEKHFVLWLYLLNPSDRTENLLSPTFKINKITSKGDLTLPSDYLQYYRGVSENGNFKVHGGFQKGIFTGAIHDEETSYYVELAENLGISPDENGNIAIIYRMEDLKYDVASSETRDGKSCPITFGHAPNTSESWFKSQSDTIKRRKARSYQGDVRVCDLHIVADHTFYQQVGNEGISATLSEIMFYISEADAIFRSTDFNGDGQSDNIGFSVTAFTIFEDEDAQHYYMNDAGSNADDYLESFSLYDFSQVCLAVSFTHIDFQQGIIGLAWMASSSVYDSVGGICSHRVFHDGDYYSFNTLLVTSKNYGRTLPMILTALTTAHEFGHSFGSPHDPSDSAICSPGGSNGYYIMHPHSIDSEKPNNRLFSECSKNSIAPVIVNKGSCLRHWGGPICGNLMIEEGEECDCGTVDQCEHTDPCCTPSGLEDETGCTVRRSEGKECSPKVSPCCDESCSIIGSSGETLCKRETDCASESFCDGVNASCPAPQHYSDGTLCNDDSGVCSSGYCSGSLCDLLGRPECQCTSDMYMCHICCLYLPSSGTETCLPLHFLGIKNNGDPYYRSSGASCDNNQGYCNSQHECIRTDGDGTIDRIKNFFNDKILKPFLWFMKNYWYYVLLGFILIFICIEVAWLCYKQKKSSRVDILENARIAVLGNLARQKQRDISNQLVQLEENYQESLNHIDNAKHTDFNETLSRMKYFFPTAPEQLLRKTLNNSCNEEYAVRQVLLLGYPMRKLHTKSSVDGVSNSGSSHVTTDKQSLSSI